MSVLHQILDYAMMLEERGVPQAAMVYVEREFINHISDETKAIDQELLTLPVHLYSTRTLVQFLAITYYYKKLLSNRAELFEKAYNEIVFVRGERELEKDLLILQ